MNNEQLKCLLGLKTIKDNCPFLKGKNFYFYRREKSNIEIKISMKSNKIVMILNLFCNYFKEEIFVVKLL